MKDNEIIKALECCGDSVGINHECSKCPKLEVGNDMCEIDLHDEARNLINRQKAEIERLKGYNENLQTANVALSNEILDIKSEAIKEVLKRVKKTLSEFDMSSVGLPDYDRGYADCKTAIEDVINDLEEEMTDRSEEE